MLLINFLKQANIKKKVRMSLALVTGLVVIGGVIGLNYMDRSVRMIWQTDVSKNIELSSRLELRHIEPKLQEVIVAIQNSSSFKELSKSLRKEPNEPQVKKELEHYLSENFTGSFFTRNVLRGVAVRVHDTQFSTLAMGVALRNYPSEAISPQMYAPFKEVLLKREGKEKLSPHAFLYADEQNRAMLSMVMPFGGLKVVGYIELLVDPLHNLKALTQNMGLPLRIQPLQGDVYFQSEDWSPSDMTLLVERHLHDDQNKQFATVSVLQNLSEFRAMVHTLEWTIGSTMMVILGLLMLLVGLAVDRMLKPVEQMRNAMVLASQGNFSERVKSNGNRDEIGQISDEFNRLMDALQRAISSVASALSELAQGNMLVRVTSNYPQHLESNNDLARLCNMTNASLDRLALSFDAIRQGVSAIEQGKFDVKLTPSTEVQGDFRQMVMAMQSALTGLNNAVSNVVDLSAQMSDGNFSGQISIPLTGMLDKLKQNLNTSMRNVDGALGEIIRVANALSEGNLGHQVQGNYGGSLGNLKSAINHSVTELSQTVRGITSVAATVTRMTNELKASSRELAHRAQEQAAALEETSASVVEMASGVQESEAKASGVSNQVTNLSKNATEGEAVMRNAIVAMQSIQSVSSRINDITQLINSISFQTNLLALNAAVEAARAGEHGRGFAVVAGEVRGLAQKSAAAAHDIKMLIESSHDEIAKGTQLVNDSGKVFSDIIFGVVTVEQLVQGIAQTAGEQNKNVREMNQAIAQIDSVGQQNAALVEENSVAADQLSDVANELRQMMAKFNLSS